MISRVHVQPYLGQPIMVRTHEGTTHYGVLHSIANDGIFLRSTRGRAGMPSADESVLSPEVLGKLTDDGEITQAWWPFFFLPWLAIAAFSPWWGW